MHKNTPVWGSLDNTPIPQQLNVSPTILDAFCPQELILYYFYYYRLKVQILPTTIHEYISINAHAYTHTKKQFKKRIIVLQGDNYTSVSTYGIGSVQYLAVCQLISNALFSAVISRHWRKCLVHGGQTRLIENDIRCQ